MCVFNPSLSEIPAVFCLNRDTNSFKNHLYTDAEKKWLVNFVSIINVELKQIQQLFGIHRNTICKWKNLYPPTFDPLSLLKAEFTISLSSIASDSEMCVVEPSSNQDKPIVRRKKFTDLAIEVQRKLVNHTSSKLWSSFAEYPEMKGYIELDKKVIFKLCCDKVTSSQYENEKLLLKSLLETFKTSIRDCFTKKDTARAVQLLSILFPTFTLSYLNQRFEDVTITTYYYTKAHRHSLCYGAGMIAAPQFTRSNCTISAQQLSNAATFAFNAKYYKPMAYGIHQVKLSRNEKVDLPNYIRKCSKHIIWDDYKKVCNENPAGPKRITKKSFYELLDLIGKDSDKLLAALDTASLKYGDLNFKKLKEFLQMIAPLRFSELAVKSDLIQNYLKYDFKDHLSNESLHSCCNYKYCFEEIYTKDFSLCENCKYIIDFMLEVNQIILNLSKADLSNLLPNSLADLCEYRNKLFNNLFLYISHLVRVKHESQTLKIALESLRDDEFLLILDWKMKILMMMYRESMTDFFGKRGISLLGVALIRKRRREEFIEGEEQSEIIVEFHDLTTDETKEDSFAAFSALEGLLKLMKSKTSMINMKSFKIYTDSAGCFHSNTFLYYLSKCGELTGIMCTEHLLSEAGEGKTFLDAHFSYLKKFMENKVVQQSGALKIIDAKSVAETLSMNGGIKNSFTYIFSFDRAKAIKQKNVQDIKYFKQRIFEYNNKKELHEIKLREQSFRKENEIIYNNQKIRKLWSSTSSIDLSTDAVIVEKEHGEAQPEIHKKKRKKSTHEVEEEIDAVPCQILQCPESNCAAMFIKPAYLQRHLQSESHFFGCSDAIQTNKARKNWDPPTSRINVSTLKNTQVKIIADCSNQYNTVVKKKAIEISSDQHLINSLNSLPVGSRYSEEFLLLALKFFIPGFACGKAAPKGKRSLEALEFLKMWIGLGTESESGVKASKVSPERAAEIMTLVGTCEGEKMFPNHPFMKASPDNRPRFKLTQLLDHFQLKSYASKPLSYVNNMIQKAKEKNQQSIEVNDEEDEDEDE